MSLGVSAIPLPPVVEKLIIGGLVIAAAGLTTVVGGVIVGLCVGTKVLYDWVTQKFKNHKSDIQPIKTSVLPMAAQIKKMTDNAIDISLDIQKYSAQQPATSAPPASLLQEQEDIDLEKAIQASFESITEDVAVSMAVEASFESIVEDVAVNMAIEANLKDLKEVWINDFNVYFNYELEKYGKQNVEDLEKMQEVMANLQPAELEENLLHYQEVINYYDNPEAIENIDEVEAKSLMHAIYAKAIIEIELHIKE